MRVRVRAEVSFIQVEMKRLGRAAVLEANEHIEVDMGSLASELHPGSVSSWDFTCF